MNIEELLNNNLGIDTTQEIWVRAFRKFRIDTGEKVEQLECLEGYNCKITLRTNQGKDLVKGIQGCVIDTTKGLVVFGVQFKELPITLLIKGKSIRVLQISNKFLNTVGTVRTDDLVIEFTVPKKFSTQFEVMLSRANKS